MSVKYPTYVNLTSLSEEQPNERTLSPPPRKKSLSPPQALLKSISSKSTHYTSSSSPSGQTNMFDDDVDEAPIQDLALNKDNVFQADHYDAFDSDVDEAPTAQTMFMANLSSANPVHYMIRTFYLSNIMSYEQYVKDNAVQVIQSNASSLPNDALMMIINDMHKQSAQCVFINEQNKVVNES
ncbi:hypothetical protein Tco_0233065 [Tanacetum coccineum]